jgi:hypothetical protein
MLSSCHQTFVDDLGGIVPTSIDMYTLLYHRVGPCTQCLSGLVPTWLNLRSPLLLVLLSSRAHCVEMRNIAHSL